MKPAAWMCVSCGDVSSFPSDHHHVAGDELWSHRRKPLFTRDDLVRVADKMRAAFILELDDVVLASVLHLVADATPTSTALVDEMLREGEG